MPGRIAAREKPDRHEGCEVSHRDRRGVSRVLSRQIATYKIPRYVRFASEFPMTVTGKVQKFKMREPT